MSDDTNQHFFGPYFEIQVKEQALEDERVRTCENGHGASSEFCPICGSEVKEKVLKSKRYPYDLEEVMDAEECENRVSEITPPKLRGTGIMLAKSESLPEWFELGQYEEGLQAKRFPTSPEVEAMKTELLELYDDVFKYLNGLESVISIEVKAGYVLDAEW